MLLIGFSVRELCCNLVCDVVRLFELVRVVCNVYFISVDWGFVFGFGKDWVLFLILK